MRLFYMLYPLILALLLIVLIGTSCAGRLVPVRTRCPPDPELCRVTVVNGTVSGEDLDCLISNVMKLWETIYVNKKLGCTE